MTQTRLVVDGMTCEGLGCWRARVAQPRRGPAGRRRGAFRRFKDELARWSGELERWHALSEERQRGRARSWLAAAGYRVLPADYQDS